MGRRTGHETRTLIEEGRSRTRKRVVFSPDGKRLASSIASGVEAEVLGRRHGAGTSHPRRGTTGRTGSAVSPTDAGSEPPVLTRTVKVWDAATGHEIRTLKGHTGFVYSVAFSPDGTEIASSDGKAIKIWAIKSGQEILALNNGRFSSRVWRIARR